MIVRRALPDMLPEKVRWRGGKTVNSPAVTAAFGDVAGSLLTNVIEKDPAPLDAFVDTARLKGIFRRYLEQRDLGDELLIWQAVTLALWLRHTGLAP
jgi:hypothetical protein